MGILNVTPDSFSDGGRFDRHDLALARAREMVAEGADIIDIGGESTRPGHVPIDAEVERARVLPVIEALAPTLAVPISIDTTKSTVARAAVAAGARMINDVWGLKADPGLADVAAEAGAELIIMHNRAEVDAGIDIVDDMLRFFEESLRIARRAGVPDEGVVLDPGIGFGKTLEQNLHAVKAIPRLKALGFRVLLGVSRKSSIGAILDKPVGERLFGTIAMNLWAVRDRVDIIRVHDIAAHVDALKIFAALEDA